MDKMPQDKSNRVLTGVLALVLLAGIYGFIGYFSRELAPGLSLWQQLYLRYILAVPFLWLTFRRYINFQSCLDLLKSEPALVIFRTLCLSVISVPLYFYAAQNAKLGNVALLQVLPYTFVFGVLINKERLTRVKIALMLFALYGAYLIAFRSGLDISNLGRGEVASIVSGALISLGLVTRKKHKAKANDYEITFTIISLATILAILFSFIAGDTLPRPAETDARFFVLLLIAAYINSFIFLLANYGFRYVRDTLANNIMALEGVFGVIFGFIIYREVPVGREVIGASIILLAAVMSTYLIKKKASEYA